MGGGLLGASLVPARFAIDEVALADRTLHTLQTVEMRGPAAIHFGPVVKLVITMVPRSIRVGRRTGTPAREHGKHDGEYGRGPHRCSHLSSWGWTPMNRGVTPTWLGGALRPLEGVQTLRRFRMRRYLRICKRLVRSVRRPLVKPEERATGVASSSSCLPPGSLAAHVRSCRPRSGHRRRPGSRRPRGRRSFRRSRVRRRPEPTRRPRRRPGRRIGPPRSCTPRRPAPAAGSARWLRQ
jgi:hypothetical protein